jgi:molybdate/tungstate transport system substrate-binding protein
MKTHAVLAATMLAFLPTFVGRPARSAVPAGTVQVAYAGSLVATMEGPMKAALRERTGLNLSGEAKGSRALANLISAGLRSPDVFISADPALIAKLKALRLVRSSVVFGSARMVVAYSAKSPHRALFERVAAGKASILDVLGDPGVRVGRTDPQLDPKGARTIRALQLLGGHFRDAAKAQAIEAKAETFPEEDLAVRVESGEVDAGFFYSTEIPGRSLQAVELPSDANLSHDIAYALAVMQHAPNPRGAETFARFVLNGTGKAILEKAGVRYFTQPHGAGS